MSTPRDLKTKYGPWALVTGAARGLGAEFSRQIADRGINVVMVDILSDELTQIAGEIQKNSGQETRAITADLSDPGFIETIREQTEGLEIGLMVSNAAISSVGLFFEIDVEEKLKMIAINVQAPLILTQEFGAKMVTRKQGGIILLSSASALQGSAHVAHYAATKAYNLILAESLWEELRTCGVDVLGFMPGTTRTPGYLSSAPHPERRRRLKIMEAGPTVTEALEALGKKPSHIAGAMNRLTFFLTGRLMPRKKMITLVGKTMRDLYGHQ